MASARMVDEEKVLLCIGVGTGRVLRVGEGDLWGREVNYASKLGEDTAGPGDILVTAAMKSACEGAIDGVTFEPISDDVAGSTNNYRVVYPRFGKS